MTGKYQEEKGFRSLLPCHILCWSDGASHGKLSSPELIRGTCRTVRQADGEQEELVFLEQKIQSRKTNRSELSLETQLSASLHALKFCIHLHFFFFFGLKINNILKRASMGKHQRLPGQERGLS